MKKSLATIIAALSAVSGAFAAEAPLWLRNTAISPDGATIAFTYRGDIFTVPVGGGGRQLSSGLRMTPRLYGAPTAAGLRLQATAWVLPTYTW